MLVESFLERRDFQADTQQALDFIDHLDDWLEYLVKLLEITDDDGTRKKYERQIKYLVKFRCGANCNIAHNQVLMHYYSTPAQACDEGNEECLSSERSQGTDFGARANAPHGKFGSEPSEQQTDFVDHLRALRQPSMAIPAGEPMQACYLQDTYAYSQILKALASEDLFFLQGPPGTGKTTAIVEIVLQTLRHKPDARILITSETHIAVDNALDRLTKWLTPEQMQSALRYPQFNASALENEAAYELQAQARADALWSQARQAAPELTLRLQECLEQGREKKDGGELLPRWTVRNLADKHQIIGVTCNQINHLFDEETEMFDLAIVDECSKATMPEWIMALTVSQKCVLVGDHKQLPPTFCQEESQALKVLDKHKEKLIRDGVIERIFENFPTAKKGSLLKQYRMLPHIGQFISKHFYNSQLEHHRKHGDGHFQHFGWLTYEGFGLRVPAQEGTDEVKIFINQLEVKIIIERLQDMREQMLQSSSTKSTLPARLSVAVITPYSAQSKALKDALKPLGLDDCFDIEVATVDAFQGRQADIVFFSFVRTVGSAQFYADSRRINVAISRARDCVYLVGDIRYLESKRLPVPLEALVAQQEIFSLYRH